MPDISGKKNKTSWYRLFCFTESQILPHLAVQFKRSKKKKKQKNPQPPHNPGDVYRLDTFQDWLADSL